jgi:hypothetical protein
LLLAGCNLLVAIEDVPTPVEDGGALLDAARDGFPSDAPAADADSAVPVEAGDAPYDVTGSDAPGDDGAGGGREAGRPDGSPSDAASDVTPPPSCPAVWNKYSDPCDACGKANCCAQLAACEAPSGGGIKSATHSRCVDLVDCIAAYANTTPGQGETNCSPQYLPAEQTAAESVLGCVRANCVLACGQL